MLNVIALAVLPALILLFYTYQQDKMQREPAKMIGKGFLWGCLSVFCSFFMVYACLRIILRGGEFVFYWLHISDFNIHTAFVAFLHAPVQVEDKAVCASPTVGVGRVAVTGDAVGFGGVMPRRGNFHLVAYSPSHVEVPENSHFHTKHKFCPMARAVNVLQTE
jgi:hypothetical protein